MSSEKRKNTMKICRGLFFSLVLVFHSFVFPVNAETILQKNVLLLHADNPLLPANIIMDHHFNVVLKLTNPRPVALYSEYLELVRFHSEIVEKKTTDLLKEKYSKLKLDLILITDDQSWDFMIAHGKDVFPEAPIVFCGITAGKIDVNTLKPNVTGNFKSLDVKSNFENILRIQPSITEIYVIVGTSEQDAFYEAFAFNAAVEYEKKSKNNLLKRKAFRSGLIENGDAWMDMIKSRNLTTHAYDETTASKIAAAILDSYYAEFAVLRTTLYKLKQEEHA